MVRHRQINSMSLRCSVSPRLECDRSLDIVTERMHCNDFVLVVRPEARLNFSERVTAVQLAR